MFMPDSDAPPPPLRPDEIDSRVFASSKHLGLRDNILDGVLEGINQEKFSGQQFISAINKTAGAKTYADDIGLTEFLATKKSFTKDEIARFVKQETPTLEKREFSGLICIGTSMSCVKTMS